MSKIRTAVPVVSVLVRVPADLYEQIKGEQNLTAWIVQAIRERIEREENQ